LQGVKCYTVDLTKLDGSGDIHCPKCGSLISSDDETEDNSTILETIIKEDNLDKMILKCNKCQTGICLTGFQLLRALVN
jgi:predicted nucleic-acid-binding Zn-ribbon protein